MSKLRFGGSMWINLDIALRNVENFYKLETETLGLSVVEWYVLCLLYEEDGQRAGQLAQGIGRAATEFTPTLDSLQNKGLLERRIHTRDHRVVEIYLTKQGQTLREQIITSAEKIESQLQERFIDADLQTFQRVLLALQSAIP